MTILIAILIMKVLLFLESIYTYIFKKLEQLLNYIKNKLKIK